MNIVDLNALSKKELIKLIMCYDKYIIDYVDEHGICIDGCCPVCIGEFYDNEFQEQEK
jgi:hypothetical protein